LIFHKVLKLTDYEQLGQTGYIRKDKTAIRNCSSFPLADTQPNGLFRGSE